MRVVGLFLRTPCPPSSLSEPSLQGLLAKSQARGAHNVIANFYQAPFGAFFYCQDLAIHPRTNPRMELKCTAYQRFVKNAPADFIAAQLKAIVGIEIPILSIEGKWKISQNRQPADRQGVIDGLRTEQLCPSMLHMMEAP